MNNLGVAIHMPTCVLSAFSHLVAVAALQDAHPRWQRLL